MIHIGNLKVRRVRSIHKLKILKLNLLTKRETYGTPMNLSMCADSSTNTKKITKFTITFSEEKEEEEIEEKDHHHD